MKKNRRLHGILVPIPDPDAQMSNPESDSQENKKKNGSGTDRTNRIWMLEEFIIWRSSR